MFKPEIPDKYDGRLNPAEFLSVYTIIVQAAGGREEKVFANYFPLALKSNVSVRSRVPAKPLRFKLWGARRVLSSYRSMP